MTSRGLGYVPALDGIRAVAILLVIGYHYFALPPGGEVGVDLFFVLSGFLITALLLEERASRGMVSLRSFYVRRARRLFPALGVMVAVFLTVATVRGEHRVASAAAAVSYVGNILLAYGIAPVINHSPMVPLWSLAEEEQFYMLWPCALLLLLRSRRVLIWLCLFIVVLLLYRAGLDTAGHSYTRLYYGPDTHASGLLVGCLLALWRVRFGLNVGERGAKAAVVLVAASAVIGWHVPGWAAWGQPMLELGSALLVVAALSQTELARGLSSPWLVWIGKRSYSLYLWHVPAMWLIFGSLLRPLALALAFVLAACSYRFIEQPLRVRTPLARGPVLRAQPGET